MSEQPPAATNVFDAAKAIAETLKPLDKQQQEQAIRYASDSLGLRPPSHPHSSAALSTDSGTAIPPQSTAARAHSTDIKTFAAEKAPKNDIQFTVVVAYFYQFVAHEQDRKDAIDGEVLKNAARQADRRRPGNAAQTLRNAKNAGYLDSAGSGKFKINAVGENLVAVALPGDSSEVPPSTRARVPTRRNKKVTKRKARSTKRSKRGR